MIQICHLFFNSQIDPCVLNFGVALNQETSEEVSKLISKAIITENGFESELAEFKFTVQESKMSFDIKCESEDLDLIIPSSVCFHQNVESPISENISSQISIVKSIIQSKKNHYIMNTGTFSTLVKGEKSVSFTINESAKEKVQKFSYLNYSPLSDLELVSPLYMPLEIMSAKKSERIEDIFSLMQIKDNGELLCSDPKLLTSQKGIIKDLIISLTSSLSEGRGIVGVSLPIRVFEPRSTIERIVDWWAYIPLYIHKAVAAKTIKERMKVIVTLTFSSLHASMSQWKPFNPILGETYEGSFVDGSKIYCEHISHHPPITAFYVKGDGYKFYGSFEYLAKTSKTCNDITFWQEGKGTFEFDDGMKITFSYPLVTLKGMIYGERLISYNGSMIFECEKESVKAIINFGVDKPNSGLFGKLRSSTQYDQIKGKIYVANATKNNNEVVNPYKDTKNAMKEASKMSDCKTCLSEISGSYFKNIEFDGVETWSMDLLRPNFSTPMKNPLPSDCRFREDLIWLKYGDEKEAQKWKVALEVRQRLEKKLRTELKGE